jgi:hypothetical protein
MRITVSRQNLLHLVAENYPAVAHGLLAPLLDVLSFSREACGGDADKFLIVLVVAIRTAADAEDAGPGPARRVSAQAPVLRRPGINIQSVAAVIGAPKETVRRKVCELAEAGWIERRGAQLHFTARADRELARVRERIETMAARHHEIVGTLVDAPPAGRVV